MKVKRKMEYQHSYKTEVFKIKTVTRDKEGQYIIIKGSIQVEDITLKIYMHPAQEHFNV